MARSISKTWNKAGYDPGQKISLSVSFVSRTQYSVTFAYSFTAKSLGQDDYKASERCNRSTLQIGGAAAVWTYQAHGNKASRSASGYITVSGVGSTTTSLAVYFTNERIQLKKTWSSPKSTGVIATTHIGNIDFDANILREVNIYAGNTNQTSNIPKSFKVYWGDKGTLPSSSNAIDKTNCYVTTGHYTTGNVQPVNAETEGSSRSDKQKAPYTFNMPNHNLSYYVLWKPQKFNYEFIADDVLYDSAIYTYSSSPISAPAIPFNYKTGYALDYWRSLETSKNYIAESLINETCTTVGKTLTYNAVWKAITGNIVLNFNTPDVSDQRVSYTYDSKIKFTDYTGSDNTKVWPGYKLIGWSYNQPSQIYLPNEATGVDFEFNYNGIVKYINNNFKNSDFVAENGGIQLYAVWEYYSTSYIYTNKGKTNNLGWKLALPYILKDGKWHLCLSYLLTDKGKTTSRKWKL